jgi:hypothetical protein
MYIQGHIEIINDVLDNSEKLTQYFKSLPLYKNVNRRMLKKGLAYVDAPCGKYEIVGNKLLFQSRRLCELSEMLRVFHETEFGESKVFQFHNGFFSHLHSMSTDPENSVLKIRNKILLSILGFALLSVYDDIHIDKDTKFNPNIMWIGMILHIITDSYSPAHTIRYQKAKFYISNPSTDIDVDKQLRLYIHERLKTLAKDTSYMYRNSNEFNAKLKREYKNNFEAQKFIEYQKRKLWNTYKVFKYEYQTNEIVRKICREWKIRSHTNDGAKGKIIPGDIITFQHYAGQPAILHHRLDLLRYIKNNHVLYDRMKNECTELFIMYKEVLESQDVQRFLKGVFNLVINKTFRINQKFLKDATNKVYYDSDFSFSTMEMLKKLMRVF